MENEQIVENIKKIKNNEERSVAELLNNMGFTFIDSNCIIKNVSKQRVGEIDLLFVFNNYLLIIEVSKDKSSGSSKKIAFFTKWAAEENQHLLTDQYNLSSRKILRIYFELAKNTPENTPENTSAEIIRLTQDGKGNKIAYLDDYEYFLDNFKKINKWSKNDFLDWINYTDEVITKEIDAIQYYMGDTPAFCFVEKVDALLKTCYVSRRRTNDNGYQRALRKSRVTGISNNIKNGNGLAFPNSILISVPNITNNIVKPEVCPKMVKIKIPCTHNTCRIIDGQHRLLGFSAVDSETRRMYSLPVIALQNYDRAKEIKTFVDMNSKQQKIDSNLILLLKADLDWAINTKEQKEKIAVHVVEKLNKSFLSKRIYFGKTDEIKKSKITLSTLVSALIGNNQIQDTVQTTYKKIHEIFTLIQKYMPSYAFHKGMYFGENQGIRVLFRLMYLYQRNTENGIILVSKDDFINDLKCIMNESIIKKLNDLYGEGGAKAAADLLVNDLKSTFPDKYEKMITRLNKLKKKK